ncbi:hypothetical protein HNY73_021859 [Argiope bruennichi]|uniref:Uncharacterized protein n=1 Tax=Argiope bruennichi TaxID=94029 RepID=A0A8T0E355_ARGBR|nr:hypothetical protein HNY73_021859 [Argiope bruennichi]
MRVLGILLIFFVLWTNSQSSRLEIGRSKGGFLGFGGSLKPTVDSILCRVKTITDNTADQVQSACADLPGNNLPTTTTTTDTPTTTTTTDLPTTTTTTDPPTTTTTTVDISIWEENANSLNLMVYHAFVPELRNVKIIKIQRARISAERKQQTTAIAEFLKGTSLAHAVSISNMTTLRVEITSYKLSKKFYFEEGKILASKVSAKGKQRRMKVLGILLIFFVLRTNSQSGRLGIGGSVKRNFGFDGSIKPVVDNILCRIKSITGM